MVVAHAFVAFVLVAASATASAAQQATQGSSPVPVLQPGDAVRITVWRQPEFSGEFDIAANGAIRHPLYRHIVAVGVDMDELEQRIRRYLERFEASPEFIVVPLLRVAVTGEVRQPNLLTLPPETTIPQVIARAGGATERANLDRVLIRRSGREIRVDLTQPDPRIAAMTIASGDEIVVPRRTSVFREYVAPVATIAGATAAVVNVILRNR